MLASLFGVAVHRAEVRLFVIGFGIFFLGVSLAQARQQPLPLQHDVEEYALAEYLEVLPDAAGSLTIDEVTQPARQAQFQPFEPLRPNSGSVGTYWLRFRVVAPASVPRLWLLELKADDVTAYLADPQEDWTVRRSGFRVPMPEQDMPPGFPPRIRLAFDPGQPTTVYLRVQHDYGSYVASDMQPEDLVPVLRPAQSARKANLQLHLGQGLFLGFMLALAGYNLFLFASIRDRSHLYYVLFLVIFSLFWGLGRGLIQEVAWPSRWPVQLDLIFYLVPAGNIAYLLFSRSFLRLRRYAPRMHAALGVLIMLSLVPVGLAVAGLWRWATLLMALLVPGAMIASMIAAVLVLRRGFRSARFFLAACLAFVAGVVVYTLAWAGWLPRTPLTVYGVQVGSMLEALLFSFGLGDHVRILRSAKEQAERQAQRAEVLTKALHETSELKTQLLGMASHDLRTPLTSIKMAAECLHEELEQDPDIREYAAIIGDSTRHMMELLEDLLDTVAIQSGKLKLHKQPMHLAPLAEGVVRAYRPLAEAKGQTLRLERPSDDLLVEADDGRLREAMDNLISNGVKYSALGATIRVEVARHETRVRFAVHDGGPGLTADEQRHLFQPFRRLSPQPSGGEPSTGLGLAITRHLIELHGGRIGVDSTPGEGSTFYFELPLASGESGLSRRRAPASKTA